MTQAFKALSVTMTIKLKVNKSRNALMGNQIEAENHIF
jgi:hypothetical protein